MQRDGLRQTSVIGSQAGTGGGLRQSGSGGARRTRGKSVQTKRLMPGEPMSAKEDQSERQKMSMATCCCKSV